MCLRPRLRFPHPCPLEDGLLFPFLWEDGLLLPFLWEDALLDFPEPSRGGIGRDPKVDGEVGQEVIPQLNPDTMQVSGVTFDTNRGVVEEITPPLFSPAARQEDPDEDFVNDEVEPVGIGSEGTEEAEIAELHLSPGPSGKRKRKEKTPREEKGNKKTTRGRNVITLENILQVKEMRLKGAAELLKVSQSTLKRVCRECGINRWPPRKKHQNIGQSLPPETPAVVDQEGIPLLTSDTLPFDQALTATVDTNSVTEETPPLQFSLTVRQEKPDEDYYNDEVQAVGMGGIGIMEGEMERNEKTPAEERGKYKTTGVRIEVALDEMLRCKEIPVKEAARELKVSRSRLNNFCREYGIHKLPPREEHKIIRQSLPDEIPTSIDQEGILTLISNCVPSNQTLMVTADANSVVKEIPQSQFLPTARQENRDENATDEVEAIGMGALGTGEGEMEEGQLNSGCSGKRKRNEKTSRGERGKNKTTGVRIAIPLEDILQTKEMSLKDAAKHLNVSRSTLKRACREYNIYRWPPRKELKLLNQYSLPNKSPTVVDKGQIPELKYDMVLPSNQVPTAVNTNSTVTVKARYGKETIKFRLSWPWRTVELKQQVKKRLELEAGTYCIRYKDEDDEFILIACDDDLQDCISSSSPLSSKSIEILLEPK